MIRSNRFYSLQLDDDTGDILSFRDSSGKEYIGARTPLIQINLLNGAGERRKIRTGAEKADISDGGDALKIRFRSVGGEQLDCEATVRMPSQEGNTYWSLRLENRTGDIVECIDFPGVTVFSDLIDNGGSRKLFSPAMEGVEIRDANLRGYIRPCKHTGYPPGGWEGVYPGACPLQFMAYYDGEDGLYFASHDAEGNFKFIEWLPENGGIRLLHEMFPQMGSGESYEYPYEVVLGAFKGDWYDAAEMYRAFVESSGMIRVPRADKNTELPDWVAESPVVITYPVRGTKDTGDMTPNCFFPYSNALPYIERYAKLFDSKIMALLMHWEGTAPWAPPYVMPPFGGTEMLNEFAEKLHAQGNLLGVYCSGIGWTQNSGNVRSYSREAEFEEKNLAACMEVGPDQKLRLTPVCCWPIRNGYDMCPACEPVKEIAVEEASRIVGELDVDYVQFFDQNIGGNAYGCYSRSHGHPPAPGKWMILEMRDIIRKMRRRFRELRPEKKILLGCESAAAEPLVNELFFNDLRYNINYLTGVPVPAYSYVFHGYVCNYMGNHNCSSSLIDLRENTVNIYYRYAYSFCEGDILTVVLKKDGKINWEWDAEWDDTCEPEQEPLIAYIALLNSWRKGVLQRALRLGRMVKPYPVRCGLYSEKLTVGSVPKNIEEIVSMRYTTDEGEDLQIFVNFQSEEKEFSLIAGDLELIFAPDGTKSERRRPVGGEHRIRIAPRSVLVAKFKS